MNRTPAGGVSSAGRVLHVTEAYGGGVASVITEYARSTPEVEHHLLRSAREGHSVGTSAESGFASVTDMGASPATQLRAVLATIRRLRPDVVHVHSSKAGALVRAAVPRMATRVVYTPHGFAFERRDVGPAARVAFREAERALSLNTTTVAACGPWEATLARRLRPGLDVVEVPNVVGADVLPARRGHDGPPRVGAVGRLTAARDPDYVAEVAREVRRLRPDVEFVWLGGSADYPAYEHVLRAAGVSISGWLDRGDLLERMAGVDVVVHGALWDGFPMVVLEALSMGIPVAIREIDAVRHLPAEALFRSPTEHAEGIVGMLDPAYRKRFPDAVWDGVLADHSRRTHRERTLRAYGMTDDHRRLGRC